MLPPLEGSNSRPMPFVAALAQTLSTSVTFPAASQLEAPENPLPACETTSYAELPSSRVSGPPLTVVIVTLRTTAPPP